MKLNELLVDIEIEKIIGNKEIEITNIQTISNHITKGGLFICIKGNNIDSHELINEVESFGAVAIICERELHTNLTQIIVKNTRKIISQIAKNFYNNPLKDVKLVGVTGTNGKTTTTHIIKHIFDTAKINCGLIGTLGVYFKNSYYQIDMTTPDPLDLYRYFDMMKKNDVKIIIMEVSAHAIYFNKLNSIDFDVGIFTNCTQDHLDFFKTMDEYKKTKFSFFKKNFCKYIITNNDDELGQKISKSFSNIISYGIDNPADVFSINIKEKDNTSFIINLFDKIYEIKTNLIGVYNVYNIMASCICTAVLGVNLELIVNAISTFKGVNGRLEKVFSNNFSIYIDYAHTPDGLKKTILTLKNICKNNLICLFGCGGNRDSEKRKIMGEISCQNADFTIITSDNPRFEEPFEIMLQIEKGFKNNKDNFVMIENRKKAIQYAISIAKRGDIILIAGKGAENYQDIMGIKYQYNDKDCILNTLKEDGLI